MRTPPRSARVPSRECICGIRAGADGGHSGHRQGLVGRGAARRDRRSAQPVGKGDGRWKTYGSYGWFYDTTKLELPRGSFGGDHWIDYTWTLDTPDYNSIQCGEGTTGCPGTYIGPKNGYDFRHSSNQVDELFEAYFQSAGHDRHRPEPQARQDG